MNPKLCEGLAEHLGSDVASVRRISGGEINEVFEVALHDGRRVLIKTNAAPLPAMYACEAKGLRLLAQAGALRVPEVLAQAEAEGTAPAFLALELIRSARRITAFDETLGRELAELHRAALPSFGLDYDNYIAILPQKNATRASWAEFYAQQRLLPQLELAKQRGRTTRALEHGIEQLCRVLPARLDANEPVARLHGDLWSGNLLVDERGAPCLIDPAVYGGAREVDLAMMRLFGGFSERVFAAYDEAYPLAADHEERVQLYQLYPLLVHVNLFGGSYVTQAEQLLRKLL